MPGDDDPNAGPDAPRRPAGSAAAGVEHLQLAARELITAARHFLDAAEEMIDDRDTVAEAAGAMGGVVREVVNGLRDPHDARPFEADLDERDERDGAHPTGSNRVRRIKVE